MNPRATPASETYEVIIAGGGPAGLSAALLLGRCQRKVLLVDAGRPRNARSPALRGFLTRDGTPPADLVQIARREIARYESIELRAGEVADARRSDGGFVLDLADGARAEGRALLLATGMVDDLPPIPGLGDLWGKSVFPCPYCDGWEWRGRRLGVLGHGEGAALMARLLTTWSTKVTWFTPTPPEITPPLAAALAARDVAIVTGMVTRLEPRGDQLATVVVEGNRRVPCEALFVSNSQHQRSPLAQRLGLRLGPRGTVETGRCESTEVPLLFVAGDASDDAQLAIVAAAEGAQAAIEMHRALLRADCP